MNAIHDSFENAVESFYVEDNDYSYPVCLECAGDVSQLVQVMVVLFREVLTYERKFSTWSTKEFFLPPDDVVENEVQFRRDHGFSGDIVYSASGVRESPLMEWRQTADHSFTEPLKVHACLRDLGPDGPVLTVMFNVSYNNQWVRYIAEAFPALRIDYFVFEEYFKPIGQQIIEKESYRNGKLTKEERIHDESEIAEIKKRIPAFNIISYTSDELKLTVFEIFDPLSL